MSFLRLSGLRIALGEFSLNGVSLDLEKGEYLGVIGPTGAGKTILLECIIGFYRPQSGRVWLDGTDITDLAPEKRRIGIVYQDYALLPHLNVFKNIAYGLRKAKIGREALEAKVRAMAEVLGIDRLLHRSPETLSGGEQQRTALARALVVEPRLLLMDEPLSALDAQTRAETRGLLRDVVRSRGATVIHITHDLDDVWALADRVAVRRGGEVIQHGGLDQVFSRPASRFVADFVDTVFFEGTVQSCGQGLSAVSVNGLTLETLDQAVVGSRVRLALRPETVIVSRSRPAGVSARNLIAARVEDIVPNGKTSQLILRSGETRFPALVTQGSLEDMEIQKDAEVFALVKAGCLRIVRENGLSR
ncbi:MAG: ATP-binding cassette domain-containing protein [Desulfovibrionaceae bacterium]|nr:ATP-binding cassette domain-containing protein [Desulfovibrionaceae bacterium]